MVNLAETESTLVPVDFSPNSMIALDHAVAMASIMDGNNPSITLLHVVEGASFNAVSSPSQIETNSRDALTIEGAINRLEKIIEKYSHVSNLKLSYLVAGGKPYKKIAEIAEQIQAETIVMGTHGSTGIQALAGSNASKVIQISPCPVVVIKEKPYTRGYKNIVLPLDLTRETKQKVRFAVKIAQYYNSTIHIISMQETDEFLSHKLRNNLAQVKEYLDERGIENTTTELDASGGSFVRQTLAWAQGRDADLIVIMADTESSGGLSGYIFGSYAQQLVNRSPIPVMAVMPDPELEGILESGNALNPVLP